MQYVVQQHRDYVEPVPRARTRVYWDMELRRDGAKYVEFVRALHARSMVKYRLTCSDSVGVFFVK